MTEANMDFDKLMDRYDNLVRRNALLEADVRTYQDRCDRLVAEVAALRDANQQYERMDWHKTAEKVCQDFPSMGKIDLIKELRDRTGCGLKDAKDLIEKVLYDNRAKSSLAEIIKSKMG